MVVVIELLCASARIAHFSNCWNRVARNEGPICKPQRDLGWLGSFFVTEDGNGAFRAEKTLHSRAAEP